VILLDTHVWLWWCADPSQLSRRAASTLENASELLVSSISAWEVAMLVQKGRLTLRVDVRSAIRAMSQAPRVRMVPLSEEIAVEAALLKLHGDPSDRLIVATAIDTRTRLVTKDKAIARAKVVETVW
jgi:PIN domain nuclease of toxin-antitoxin system